MINKLFKTTIITFFFLFPLFYLNITPDSYEYNKMMLLIVTVLILLVLLSFKIVKERRLHILNSTFGLPLFLLTLLITLSTFIQTPNRVIAATTPLGPTAWIAGLLLYLLLIQFLSSDKERENFRGEGKNFETSARSQQVKDYGEASVRPAEAQNFLPELSENHKYGRTPLGSQLMNILILDAVILSLYTIALFTGIFPQNPFTPAGSLLSTAMFITGLAVYNIFYLIQFFIRGEGKNFETSARSQSDILHQLLPYFLSLSLMIVALIFLAIHLFSDQKPLILPISFGWSIFLEILKNGKTLLLGIGPTNFLTAFILTKPVAINQTPFWNVIFTSSSSLLLTLATEVGIIAACLYLVILLKLLKLPKSLTNYDLQPLRLTLIFVLILQILLPSNMTLFILTIILLALSSDVKTIKQFSLSKIGILNYLFPLLAISFAAIILYFSARVYLAEVYFKKSLDSILNNRAQQAYNLQSDAISLNPYIDRYHLSFSKINLAIANALSAKTELTQDDQQNIPRLVQQAIDHARSAVALYRTNVVNLDNLGQIYLSLINFADGASDWAQSVLEQRIMLDPFSPGSYLAAGRFYLSGENYPEAETKFQQALTLKPDLANTHYQLGLLFVRERKYEDAYRELQTAKALLPPDSDDAKRVDTQLAELSKLLPQNIPNPPVQIPSDSSNQTLEEPIEPYNVLPSIIPTISLPESPEGE